MERKVLLSMACLAILALLGCGRAADKTNTAANNKNAPVAAATPAQNKEPAKPAMKASDITPDKAVAVKDLTDAVAASPDGWTGKQVAVTGYVASTSESGPKNMLLSLQPNKEDTTSGGVTCLVQGTYDEVSEKVFDKTLEVKGTIKHIQGSDAKPKMVSLEPCEVKK